MWVMTVDQAGSRRVGDRVDLLLASLARRSGAAGMVRPFERTVGDEVQAVLDAPALVVEIALELLATGGWTVGIGAGPVDLPLPGSSRAGSGDAFVLARAAVEEAKPRTRTATVPVAVRGVRREPAREAEAVLTLLGSIIERRTPEGREVIRHLQAAGAPVRQQDLAARLGISQQAVSARLRSALWAEEVAVRPAAARLLRLAAGERGDADTANAADDPGPSGQVHP
jgi:hypothetical protein